MESNAEVKFYLNCPGNSKQRLYAFFPFSAGSGVACSMGIVLFFKDFENSIKLVPSLKLWW